MSAPKLNAAQAQRPNTNNEVPQQAAARVPQFTNLTARCVVLPNQDVDTDQIIPARFLKVTDKLGLGEKLFCDWRYLDDGSPNPDFILNQPEAKGVKVLIAGHNFGCGSSREHAPWALVGWGFQAVISTMFADIFRGNSVKNGLLPIVIEPSAHAALVELRAQNSDLQITIDLKSQTVAWPGQTPMMFPIDPFSRTCLLEGVDELGYLQKFQKQAEAYEAAHA
ncbi:MAG: 3-isopropylmalate dehydratase small subunit [Opitutae bacterium]|nr:3-isopropylmalate dehydratase small subunit [Opitutae bacterium]